MNLPSNQKFVLQQILQPSVLSGQNFYNLRRVWVESLKFNTVPTGRLLGNISYIVTVNCYFYVCGSQYGWSKLFSFTAMKSGVNWSPRFLVYGDMGVKNARSLPRITYEVGLGMYDTLLHVGDIAYNMQDESGGVGDQFQEMVEPIAANLPYMMTPGNHDSYGNYSEYKNRFSTPGDQQGLFYSYNVGPTHIISIATEFYYYYWDTTGFHQMAVQYDWLIKDLQEATKPENRALRPWIILLGHRPMYCSNSDGDDCTWGNPRTRVGVPFLHWFGMEKLLWKYGVDIAIWAHEHSYERLWPIYNQKIYNGSIEHPYVNPKATVHLTTGSAGCQEDYSPFIKNLPYYTAFRSTDYGYSRMTIVNNTHMNWQQVSDGQGGGVIDNFWVVQNRHGSFEKQGL
ncbi:Acid phosphatase type 7 [Nymphon striatum]|nr:Acid phosphatase type 7 [Nymphon striatum]